jgi:hypothetical protein
VLFRSTAATVDGTGRVTAVSAGRIRVRGWIASTSVAPDEATLTLHAEPASGRRVVVIDAETRQPLAGVIVRGCADAPASEPCPAPQDVITGADGAADFAFASASATFTAVSPAQWADGRPRYDRVSVLGTAATTVLLPLPSNPLHGAAGFTGTINFRDVHSTGNLWLGLAALSPGDPSTQDLQTFLGEPFNVAVPNTGQRLTLPGGAVAYLSVGTVPLALKGTAYGLGQPGQRTAVGFGGKFDPAQLPILGSADLLGYVGAMDYALAPYVPVSQLPRVPDASDLDGDGLCADAQRCPDGSEEIADYSRFPQLAFTPRREQQRRTEVVVPPLPPGLDTAVLAAVEGTSESGLIPVGLSSRAGGAPSADGSRPVGPVILRSGAPYGGVETGLPGIWATAAALGGGGTATAGDNLSARLARAPSLPERVVLPPFLPVAEGSSYDPFTRVFSPGQPQWNALGSAGATVGRLTLTGTDSRHLVYFALSGSQTALRVPESPPGGGIDAASQSPSVEVTGLEMAAGVTWDSLLDLQGANLTQLPGLLVGYSRFRSQ